MQLSLCKIVSQRREYISWMPREVKTPLISKTEGGVTPIVEKICNEKDREKQRNTSRLKFQAEKRKKHKEQKMKGRSGIFPKMQRKKEKWKLWKSWK